MMKSIEQGRSNMSLEREKTEVHHAHRPMVLEFYLAGMSRDEKDFSFNIIKKTIELSTIELMLAEGSEVKKYSIYTGTTDLIIDVLRPVIDDRRTVPSGSFHMKGKDMVPDETKEEVLEYDKLLADMELCLDGYLSVDKQSGQTKEDLNDTELIIKVNAPSGKDTGSKFSEVSKAEIRAKIATFDAAADMAAENLYRRLNCTARHQYRRAYGLAVKLGFISPSDSMNLKGQGVNEKETDDYLSKTKQQFG